MLGDEIKKLGFGMMRLPKTDNQFDLSEINRMVDRFLEKGCTYFDTAYVYEGSEEIIRKALVERYPRDRFILADKLAVWEGSVKTREDAVNEFQTSLDRTGAGYFDFYLMHNISGENRIKNDEFGIWDFVLEKKAQGLIRHIGFSFHGTPEELDGILCAHPETEFVQLQINYADWDDPKIASRACYETARRHGLPVVIMEPVKGGLLAAPPESVREALHSDGSLLSPAARAVRFAANLDGVITVLSGMSTFGQLEDNLAALRDFSGMSPSEAAAIEKARAALKALPIIPCTGCNYCAKVCPPEIGISAAFNAANSLTLYNNLEKAMESLSWALKNKKSPTECVGCGACKEVCPQHLDIPALLDVTVKAMKL